MKHFYLLLVCHFLLLTNLIAQEAKLFDSVSFYGSLRAHIAAYPQTVEMQNNGSRIGFNLESRHMQGFKAEGRLELGVNLLKNNNSFKADHSTADNPSAYLVETVKPFTTRLGYLGLSHPKYGSLRIGKQWGVYYDVTGCTDMFNVFGGNASGTYNTGTDGGGEGTGRAESSIVYRKNFKNLSTGLQIQIPGHSFNFGMSMVYKLPKNFIAGIAYNYYELPSALKIAILNQEEKIASSLAVSLRYETLVTSIAAVLAYNGSEVQYPTDSTIAGFRAAGFELYARHNFTPKLEIIAGCNLLLPTGAYDKIPENFRVLFFPIGAAYYILPELIAYTELLYNCDVLITGEKGDHVATLGLKYNFSYGKGWQL